MSNFEPIGLEPVRSRDSIKLWNEYVHRYHTLGYKRPLALISATSLLQKQGETIGMSLICCSSLGADSTR
ncbi:MAG: hypothetical protein RQM95_08150 [Syntrophaceticus schinkii]